MSLAIPFLVAPILIAQRPAAASKPGAYLDILSAEASGELRSQTYDLYRGADKSQFLGNTEVRGGALISGGIGLRMVYVLKHGVRLSGEGSFAGGRLLDGELPWGATSTVRRGELLSGLGYQFAVGPLVLHAAAILGCDYSSFKVAQPLLGSALSGLAVGASSSAAAALPSDSDYQLERWGLRLGAQAGAHLQLSKMTALYTDVTFDYDGQWRTRFGFAIGNATGSR